MKVVSSKSIGTNRSEIVFEVKGEDFKKAVDQAFNKNAKKISLPGFRKGKAPRAMIEKMYGKEAFYDDAINILYPENYEAALNETGLVPVDTADVSVEEINDDGVVLKATFTTRPEAKLGEYKGISAVKNKVDVSKKEIEQELENLKQRYARLVPVEDRKAGLGDIANIDFDGYCDGKAFEGGKGEGYDLELGSGTFIPGFEDQVIGHDVNDKFDVNVKFPKDYGEKKLAGKDATFKCKINSLKNREFPDLDDDFAKDISEFDTFEEYKKDLKAKLKKQKEEACEAQFEDAVIAKVAEGIKVDIPDVMINDAMKESMSEYGMRLQQYGMKLDDYLNYAGQTIDQFLETFRPAATNKVRTRLALEAVAKAEKFKVSADEISKEYEKIAEAYKMKVEEVKKYISENDLKGDKLCQKAIDFIVKNAKAEEPKEKVADEPKTEKKSTAKTTKTTTKKEVKSEKTEKVAKAPAKKTTTTKAPAKKATTKTTKKADK